MRINKWIHRAQGFIVGAVVVAILAFVVAGGLIK